MAARTVNIKLHAGGASQVMAALGKVGGAFKKLGTEVIRGGIWGVAANAFTSMISSMRESVLGLRSAFRFETLTAQFKTLVGGIDEAKAHMADLKALGDTPPFNLEQFAATSRELMVMTDGVLGYKKSLELIGDAAAATGRPIEQLGHAVGRLFASVRDGQPLSRAVMELRNMGVLTPEVTKRLQEMQDAGESNARIWAEVEAALGRYNGAMKDTEATGEGLMGAIKSRWENFVRQFGEAFSDAAKDGMGKMLSKMEELEKSGTIEDWAEGAVESLEKVAESARGVASLLGSIAGGAWKAVKGTLGTAWAFAAGADEKFREQSGWGKLNLWQQIKSGGSVAREYWNREVLGEIPEEEVAQERAARKARSERRAELRRKRDAEEEVRKAEALAAGDLKRMEREDEAARKKETEDIQKFEAEKKRLEKSIAAERLALVRMEAKERERLDREAHQKRMADLRKEIAAQKEAASVLTSRASAAQSEFDKAFAMYRDPSRAAAEIGEEKDYQNDLDRLHRDARRYGGKWRIDELSRLMSAGDTQGVTDTLKDWRKSRNFTPEVEAMVRASAAESAKTSTLDELRKIETNTAGLDKKLDELLSMKGGS